MASLEMVRARIDADLKREAIAALDEMGMTASEAIRLLFIRVAKERALPFDVRTPNATTKAALDAAERGEVTKVANIDALLTDLNK